MSQRNDQSKYYQPYVSDQESEEEEDEYQSSDDGSNDGSDDGSDIDAQTKYINFLTGKSQIAGARPLNTEAERQILERPTIDYSYLNLPTNAAKFKEPKFTTQKNTSLIMINSRDRDTNAYPQPTNFYIRLPRTYKNITNLAITQLKFLSSFYYFTPAKENNSMAIYEQDRVMNDVSNVIVSTVRTGTYDANTLVAELNLQLNQSPLFADLSGGKSGFVSRFQTSGSFNELFAEPGDNTYNSLTGTYSAGLTKSDVISRYFYSASTAGSQLFTPAQAYAAYFYPMLYEMTIDQTQVSKLVLSAPSLLATITDGESPFNRIIYGFRGLTDPYIVAVINYTEDGITYPNQVAMEIYRSQHTQANYLANKYVCSYNQLNGRFSIVSPSISTSINTDLTNQYSNYLVQEITAQNLTTAQYATLQTTTQNANAAIGDFYNFIHQNLTNTFGVNFGTYTRDFFSDLSNSLEIFDASGYLGFATGLTSSLIGNQVSTSQVLPFDISGTWPNLLKQPTLIDRTSDIPTDSNGYIDISNSSEYYQGYVDLPFTCEPIGYVKYKFKSRCRQDLSFMTLPRTVEQKAVADASEAYILTPEFYSADGQTCLLDPAGNSDFYLYDISQSMFDNPDSMRFENNYLQYIRQQKPSLIDNIQDNSLTIPDYRPHIFFQLNTDKYETQVDISNYQFDVSFNIECDVQIPSALDIYVYEDRAAFMYDVSNCLTPASSLLPRPKNYFQIYTTQNLNIPPAFGNPSQLGISIPLRVLGNTSYYFIVKAVSSNFGSFTLRPYCVLARPYGIWYPVTNGIKFRRMPYTNQNLTAHTPSSSQHGTSLYQYDISASYIEGYNANNVSSDYTDYLIRTTDGTGFDTNNFGTKSFKHVSSSTPLPFASVSSKINNLWFYSNSSNYIIDLANNNQVIWNSSNISTFTLGPGKSTTFKIINPFYAFSATQPETFIVPKEQTDITLAENTGPTGYTLAFNGNFTGYPANEIATNSPLYICANVNKSIIDVSYNPLPPSILNNTMYSFGSDASGVTGFTFQVPPDRTCGLKQIVLKFAYINPVLGSILQADASLPNQDIQYYNNASTELRIFRTSDILFKTPDEIAALQPLFSMTRSQVYQVGSYKIPLAGQQQPPRLRNPEWGTYYTYDISGSANPLLPYPLTYLPTNLPSSVGGPELPYPFTQTYSAIPFGKNLANINTVQAFYGLSFTAKPIQYKSTDLNLLVNYQYNNLLTARSVTSGTQIQLLDSTKPPVSIISKITYTYDGDKNDPALNLTRFGNLARDLPTALEGISGELADTQLFLYDDSVIRSIDLITSQYSILRQGEALLKSTDDTAVWGQEKGTIYKAHDDDSGFNFLSYLYNQPILQGNSNVVTIRGYVPTSRFTSGLRIIGKNWTDFGHLTLGQLCNEIDDLVGAGPKTTTAMYFDTNGVLQNEYVRWSYGNYYSRRYALALLRFNALFNVKKTFGGGLGSTTYLGQIFDATSKNVLNCFRAALQSYQLLYLQINTGQTTISTANAKALASLQIYINTIYIGVLPSSFLQRSRLNDPLPFQIQFQSALRFPYTLAFDEWGLGWNLGFTKADTNFGTQQIAETFIRITDDYIYLTMNQELNMNTVDASSKEYLNQSQDTFGQSGAYFAKLLLNTFGNYSQTFVQSPKIFNPTLGKLDKLHFTWVDKNGVVLNNADCEFTVTLQITETLDILDDSSTLNMGTNTNEVTLPSAALHPPPSLQNGAKRKTSRKLSKAERWALIK